MYMRIAQTVLPLIIMLALGMLCRKKRLFTLEGIAALKSLVVNIALPAVMFSAFARAEYSAKSFIIPIAMFMVCAMALLMGFAVCKLLRLKGRLTPYLTTGFEAGMLGYALFALLFPSQNSSEFAIVDLGQVLFVFTVYKTMLAGVGSLRQTVGAALRSPVILAILGGLLVGVSGLYKLMVGWQVSGLIDCVTDFIAAPAGAVILLVIGYELVPSRIELKSTAIFICVRLTIMGALFCLMLLKNRLLLGNAIHTGALALMFTLPPPFVLPIFAEMGDEQANIISTLSAFTLVSIALFTVLTVIFA